MLYRKYRPKTFSDVVGQEHVVRTLQGAISTGRIGHAYLFCGPRGTGKTTLARLLAKSVNCEKNSGANPDVSKIPCDKCEFCNAIGSGNSLDLIEIDAASQTGVDNVRELIESARVAAPGGKKKIFIIDEVHMLSKAAFNALLKTLEEPPSHVVFVLATTEAHKILPTVLSRVQRFDFKKLSSSQINFKLKAIAKAENIKIEDDGLMAIAESADGALRDAEVALTKVVAASEKKNVILSDEVYSILGLIPVNYNPEFLGYLASGDKNSALDFISRLHSGGIDLEHFTANFVVYLRKILIHTFSPATLASTGEQLPDADAKLIASYAQGLASARVVQMLNLFVSAKEGIKSSPIPQLPLELAVLELLK